jgi:glycosyltransferase involved in cell wall biosynthesis
MKVVHIINADTRGGAPKAAFAINQALNSIGIVSHLLVQRKFSRDESVFSINNNFIDKQKTNFRMLLDLIQMRLFTKTEKGRFSFGSIGTDISSHTLVLNADIIHLHWINEGYISLKSLFKLSELKKPVVWTLHDMWAFTGGCHYSAGCLKYEKSCGNCPYLNSSSENDYSIKNWKEKDELYHKLNPTIVTPSNWMCSVAKKSSLLNQFSINVIPNPIDTSIYRPNEKSSSRKKLNLPENKTLILFGSLNVKEERKGFKQLVNAIKELTKNNPGIKDKAELLIYGTAAAEELKLLPLKVNSLGRITDEYTLVDCYNSADIFVAPSIEDNLPNTVMESLSCGIPVTAFNIGGMPDMIEHQKNGYLAKPFSVEDLAEGIFWCTNDKEINNNAGKMGREKVVDNYSFNKVGGIYNSLYKKLINHT